MPAGWKILSSSQNKFSQMGGDYGWECRKNQ